MTMIEDEFKPGVRAVAHPSLEELTLVGVLHALADPVRLEIVRRLFGAGGKMNCVSSAHKTPCLSKSTLSHHFRILREAGIVRSERCGVELLNCLRLDELEAKFPGVLSAILAARAAETVAEGPCTAADTAGRGELIAN